MKCVTEVRVGDKVRVEGYGFNSELGATGYLASMSGEKRVVNYVDLGGRFQTNPHIWFHIRNIVEIVECAPGAHVLARREMGSWLLTCSRCTSYKPEEIRCWCGVDKHLHPGKGEHIQKAGHPFQTERRKEDQRKDKQSMAITSRKNWNAFRFGETYRYTKYGWDQRGTKEDRRKGGSK